MPNLEACWDTNLVLPEDDRLISISNPSSFRKRKKYYLNKTGLYIQ